ncbi:PstS family phosphate ABC transporter substrate-binding protein [bacterium]|nr:PstS family phosphate ABC transporter substrate-binding protein [bacterium]
MKKILLLALLPVLFLSACGEKESASKDGLTGAVRVDGSSTVFPITEAVGEEFQNLPRGLRVTVGISGTGGGFKKFLAGETDINDASRPIKGKEVKMADEAGVEFVEIPVAFDGLSVLINPANNWVDHMTINELHKIWQPGSTVKTWKDVRASWPAQPITLYGPDVDSGTFDYFTEVVNGKSQVCRPDYTASADDNVLVTGIAGDVNALGYFGYAYYEENKDKLKLVPIDGGAGPVLPSESTINNGSYAPLSRPLFIYVSEGAAARPEIQAFIKFYMEQAAALSAEVGYVALPDEAYRLAMAKFSRLKTGSAFNTEKAKSGDYSISEILSW